MLVIRMQRTGRKGHAQFRVVVQDSRRTPSSGKIVATLGSYNPHSKETTLNIEKAQHYLDHGAQPSSRVAVLLQKEGAKLPKWVKIDTTKARKVRDAEKRRSTRPAEEAPEEAPVETSAAEAEVTAEEAAPEAAETPAEETPAADAEAPAEETASEETSAE